MPIEPLSSLGASAASALRPALTETATTGIADPEAVGFGDAIAGALGELSALHTSTDRLAVAAATGSLPDVHDYTIAATEAAVATELTVAVRNKALEAFTSIMNLPL